MSLKDTIAQYNQQASSTDANLRRNPFSNTYEQPIYSKDDPRYGRPESGSKTEKRGVKAGNYVCREVQFLCEIIDKYATLDDTDGLKKIKFGRLFDLYATYSDKVVGMLLRARKYGLVNFEGEMLYQRQDDHKIITLNFPMDEIRKKMQESGDPKNCIKVVK